MLSKSMQDALNGQLNMELFSAYTYASMAAYFEHENLNGFAHWMKLQVQEESAHATKIYDYINDAGGRVVFAAINKPPADFGDPVSVFEEVVTRTRKR
jgi:ferritin